MPHGRSDRGCDLLKNRNKLRTKIIVFFLFLMVLVSIPLGTIIYVVRDINATKNIELVLETGARYIDDIYSGDMIRLLVEEEKAKGGELGRGESYGLVFNLLEKVKNNMVLDRIFIFKPVFDDKGILTDDVEFLFDTMSGDYSFLEPKEMFEVGSLGDDVKIVEEYYNEDYVDEINLNSGRTTKRSYGEVFAYYLPMELKDGTIYSFVCTEISKSRVIKTAILTSLQTVLPCIILIAVYMLVFVLFVNKTVIRPITSLSEHMERFVEDDTHLNYIPFTGINTQDEIESMADSFNKMAQAILAYTKNVEKKAVLEERNRAGLVVTSQIRSLVSSEMLYPAFPERTDFDLCTSIKNTVNNRFSFCNYFLTDEDHLFIIIGESVGSGLPAMLLSVLASTNVQCFAKMGYTPHRIATETNNLLCNLEKHDKGLTAGMLIAQLDLHSGILKYVNAGMPPLLIKRTGEEFIPEKTSIQFNLGEMRGVSFMEHTIQLCQGNMLVFTSYGVPEMKDDNGKNFSESRLAETINEISTHTYELDREVFELEECLAKYRGTKDPDADTTIAVLRYFG